MTFLAIALYINYYISMTFLAIALYINYYISMTFLAIALYINYYISLTFLAIALYINYYISLTFLAIALYINNSYIIKGERHVLKNWLQFLIYIYEYDIKRSCRFNRCTIINSQSGENHNKATRTMRGSAMLLLLR